jgi:signal peptidase I
MAGALLAGALWLYFTYRIGVVPSQSMAPTLQPGDKFLINLRAYRHRLPQRGDIVVFRDPAGEYLVKRVIALPGETVVLAGGQLYVNGQPLYEPYLAEPPMVESPLGGVVPEGHVFVLGDNRNFSEDSRDLGPVPIERIMGRAEYIVSPFSRRGSLRSPWTP